MIVEMECLVCGDHKQCESNERNMCEGCGNGIYAPVKGLIFQDKK